MVTRNFCVWRGMFNFYLKTIFFVGYFCLVLLSVIVIINWPSIWRKIDNLRDGPSDSPVIFSDDKSSSGISLTNFRPRESTEDARSKVIRQVWENRYTGSCKCTGLTNSKKASFDGITDEKRVGLCTALSPWNYLGNGVVLEPLKTVRVIGLSLDSRVGKDGENLNLSIRIQSDNRMGYLFILKESDPSPVFSISGNYTVQGLTIEGKASVPKWNHILERLYYQSTTYNKNAIDAIKITERNVPFPSIFVNVEIKSHMVQFVNTSSPGDPIHKKITIITKTFERPNAINRLVKSVNEFYPNMTIIVADDSSPVTNISGRNVKHFTMPFAEGAFAGRNLALSQVRTDYFFHMDDDMALTENSRLEQLHEVMENVDPPPDIVLGWPTAQKQTIFHRSFTEDGGMCMKRTGGSYGPVKGYPDCFWVDMASFVFLGRTRVIRSVGFDPFYERVGHTELFVDGHGLFRTILCGNFHIFHKHEGNAKYNLFRSRKIDPSDAKRHGDHFINSKKNLQCFSFR